MEKSQNNQKNELFYSFSDTDAIKMNSDVYDDAYGLQGSSASNYSNRTFVGYDANYSVKSDYKRDDYEEFRKSEKVPTNSKEIMSICNRAYKRVGLVRNVIDLMSDFGVKGIRLQHSNPTYQRLFNAWAKKVSMSERSERFLNILFRLGNVVVQRNNGKLNKKNITEMKNTKAAINEEQDIEEVNDTVYRNKIVPLKYTFLNPVTLEEKYKYVGSFTGIKTMCLRLKPSLVSEIKQVIANSLKSKDDSIVKTIPKYVLDGIKSNESLIELPREKLSYYYYKKDDWEDWADPITYSILDNLIALEKMSLADMSALDGAISNIRLWTLGIFDGPNNSIMPTKAAINKLRNILANNVGGGTIDLVWGPELKFTESKTSVHQFLGSEKYKVIFDMIYDGLGIPSALRSGGSSSSSSNGHIALKTLIERLEYGRGILSDFWENEIDILCKALNIKEKPVLTFDRMILSDEAAEKQLLLHLVDRDIVSNESILEKFDFVPHIERARVNKESKKRGKSAPAKASPYHNPEKDHELKKIILQSGGVAPSEVGVELEKRKAGEKSKHDLLMEANKEKQNSFNPSNPNGRPKNVTETSKRKPKPGGKPNLQAGSASFIDTFIWANQAQKAIAEIVTPAVLSSYKKKNVRSLTKEQTQHFENLKENVFFSLEPFSAISEENAYNMLSKANVNKEMKTAFKKMCNRFALQNDRQPTVDEMREIRSSVYSLINEE